MKTKKKAPKREATKTTSTSKTPETQELSERDLDKVVGGAVGSPESLSKAIPVPSGGWGALESFQFGGSNSGSQNGGNAGGAAPMPGTPITTK